MNHKDYDFCGWASRNDLLCLDGRIIRQGAFKSQTGMKVPLAWNHQHNDPTKVLGHAYLEDRPGGVYAYAYFNDTPNGQHAKAMVKHGDVTSMSIWATNVQTNGKDVVHGVIREVSLVMAGANPGAFIESVVSHGFPMDDGDEEGILYCGDSIIISPQQEGQFEHSADGKKDNPDPKGEDPTVGEVLETLTDIQKKAVAIMVAQVVQDNNKEEDDDVRHNAFEGSDDVALPKDEIIHSLRAAILEDARNSKSLRESVIRILGDEDFMHSIDTTGMVTSTGTNDYGIRDMSMLVPEAKNLNMPPEFISRDMDWVADVLGSVSISPFAKVKTMYADITEDEARAKGYITGTQKKSEVFSILKRTTEPQTIYKFQKFDRDDILDVTEFDVIPWVKQEMRIMLNEEKARAILIGDGRLADAEDKIKEDHIRPIVSDVPLFNTTVIVEKKSDNKEYMKELIKTIIRSRKKYKGSGSPKFYTTEDVLTEMLVLEDEIGHRLYKTEEELATALRVSKIVTVEPMEGHTVSYKGNDLPLIGVIVNLKDYKVGRNPGVNPDNFFDDFELDYNKMKYLLEDRFSGALVTPRSAITFLGKDNTTSSASSSYSNSSRKSDE